MTTESVAIRIHGKYVDDVSKGMDRTVGQIKNLARVGAAVVGTAAAVGGGLYALTKRAAESGDEIDKMRQRLGVGAEFLSSFGHAAELGGSNLTEFEQGLKRMARVASDATQGLATAERSWDALNITVTDSQGRLKGAEALFWEAADALSRVESETKRAALAQEIFGRSGTQLLPVLNQGTDAIQRQMAEAKRLGIVLSDEQASRAAQFIDSQTRMQAAIRGLAQTIGLELMPQMTDAINRTAEWTAENRASIGAIAAQAGQIARFGNVFIQTADLILEIPRQALGVIKVLADTSYAAIAETLSLTFGGIEKLAGLGAKLPGPFGGVFGWSESRAETQAQVREELAKEFGESALEAFESVGWKQVKAEWADIGEAVDAFSRHSQSASSGLDRLATGAPAAADGLDRIGANAGAIEGALGDAATGVEKLAGMSSEAGDELYTAIWQLVTTIDNDLVPALWAQAQSQGYAADAAIGLGDSLANATSPVNRFAGALETAASTVIRFGTNFGGARGVYGSFGPYGNVIGPEPGGSILHFQDGGYVPRTGPAIVHEGEYVIPKGGARDIHITINIPDNVSGLAAMLNPNMARDLARQLGPELKRYLN